MINRDAHIFVAVDTGDTSDIDIAKMTDVVNDIHAGDIETSTTLAIRPELVQMDKAVDATLSFGSAFLDFDNDRSVNWYVRTDRISESGVMGNPTIATAERGKQMWEVMIRNLVKFVESVKEKSLDDLYQKCY